jgi:hypothetical protein
VRTGTIASQQKRAFGYYGFPGSPNLPVGEVRYVVGWHADQMTRLEWDVLIDGSDVWSVELPGNKKSDKPTIISTKREDGEQDVTAASKELLDLIDWTDSNIRAVDTNLFVAGQGDYIRDDKGWRVLSVVENKRKEKLAAARDAVSFIWPHPADPDKPDAPLFSVLELLAQLEWLDRQAQTQSRQRVLFSGILATADSLEGPDGKSFWDVWNETLSARSIDPDDMSPVRLQGPIGTGTGPNVVKDGLNWIMPPFGYDAVIDRRSVAAIQRLAYGLPIPPEILLGLQAQSRATAFQVEENAYRAHIEPPAWMVAQVPQDALESILEGDRTVEVRPNPTKMLARKQSVEDVKWARDNNLVTPDYTREVLSIPEDAAPEENDGVPLKASPIATDPANSAADEPVTAAAGVDLSTLLSDVDAQLSSELAGFTTAATDRARQRLGAAARTVTEIRTDPDYKPLSNAELATRLGVDGLTAAGVKVLDVIADPIDVTAQWWMKRIEQVWSQMGTLVPGWTGQGDWVTESLDRLDVALGEHIIDTLAEPDASPLDAGKIRDVIAASSGEN